MAVKKDFECSSKEFSNLRGRMLEKLMCLFNKKGLPVKWVDYFDYCNVKRNTGYLKQLTEDFDLNIDDLREKYDFYLSYRDFERGELETPVQYLNKFYSYFHKTVGISRERINWLNDDALIIFVLLFYS